MSYRLTRKAEEDIIRIHIEGVSLFGKVQADIYHNELDLLFGLIAGNPNLARERHEISPPVRIHPHKSHLIVYRIEKDDKVLVIRIRHAHEDWPDNVE